MRYINMVVVMSVLMTGIVFFSRCSHNGADDPRGEGYAAAGVCVSCHRGVGDSYAHNVHYTTSTALDTIQLEKLSVPRHGQFLAFGSGEKAQTFGYWKEGFLYELPYTYYAVKHAWVLSPGFNTARYDRMISSRCFECHASYVKSEVVQTGALSVGERLDKSSIVYGIDCQRCHGPALQHVKFHQENPSVRTAKYITSIKSLTRQQQLDICAICHSGADQSEQRSLFDFAPGDTLSHFYYPDFGADAGEPDVHGKQLQLLQASLCFQRTNMTCNTCHDAHASKGDQMAGMVAKCMGCHQTVRHVRAVGSNCVDCHMPLQTSKLIHFGNIPYLIRTHKIAVPNGPEVRCPKDRH